MRRLIWPALTLLLTGLAFGAGRISAGFRVLPAIVATLPGEERDFSRELDVRIRQRFPIGTSEDALVDTLASQGFTPEWRRGDKANAASFVWDGLLCSEIARVVWRADAAGAITDLHAEYESHCF